MIAAVFAIFVLIVGQIGVIFDTSFSGYVEDIVPLSNWIGRDDHTFYHGRTLFYWDG